MFKKIINHIKALIFKCNNTNKEIPQNQKEPKKKKRKKKSVRNKNIPNVIKEIKEVQVAKQSTKEINIHNSPKIETVQNNGGKNEGWVMINSIPSDASVYINGVNVGRTPIDGIKYKYGNYKCVVSKNQFHNVTFIINLQDSQYNKDVKLKPAYGSLNIESNVLGASIFIDNLEIGKRTPTKINRIDSGKHEIQLKHEFFGTVTQTFDIHDDQSTELYINMEPFFSWINIKTKPGSRIIIDDKEVSKSCNKDFFIRLKYGKHRIEIKFSETDATTQTIDVMKSENRTYRFYPKNFNIKSLDEIYGSLDIISHPVADIYIDGEAKGKSAQTLSLIEGIYKLKLQLSGYEPFETDIKIKRGGKYKIEETLNKKERKAY